MENDVISMENDVISMEKCEGYPWLVQFQQKSDGVLSSLLFHYHYDLDAQADPADGQVLPLDGLFSQAGEV